MAEDQEFVIVDEGGGEHVFPVGMDPKKAANIVRQRTGAKEPSGWDAHPNVKSFVRGALDTLPAVGAATGGILAAPSLATGLPGLVTEAAAVGLGAGAGRGARDLIAEKIGLEPTTTPTEKALRIGGETAIGAGTQAVVPGLLEAVKTPLKTAGEVIRIPSEMRKLLWSGEAPILTPTPKPTLPRSEALRFAQSEAREGAARAGRLSKLSDQFDTAVSQKNLRMDTAAEKVAADKAKTASALEDQFRTAASRQNLREVDAASEAVANKAAEARTLEDQFKTATSKQNLREVDAAAKADEEATRAAKIAEARGEPKKTTYRTSLSAPTPEGGRQSMSTTYKGAVRIGSEPPPPVPSAGPVAPYTHHSTDGLPRFNVMGSDVTAAEAQARGFTPSEIPAGAGAESSTAARDAALARQAARVQGQKAPARGAIPEFESTRPTPSAASTQTPVPTGVKQTDVPLRSGQELSTPGSIAYQEKEFAANNPIAQEVLGAARVGGPPPIKVDPKSVEALGGEMGPIAEAAYRRALGVPSGTKLDVGQVQALKETAEPIMSRTDAARAGKALGLDANTVRGMRGGESGLIAPDLMEVLDKAMKNMSLDEMVTYLNKAPNANVYKYIESQIKNKIPF